LRPADRRSVTCWGGNGSGQLGFGSVIDTATPVALSGLTATALAAGGVHTCAVLNGSTVSCWGDDNYGELGNGIMGYRSTPRTVAGVTGVTAISTNENSCAVSSAGAVSCWGDNLVGQLGNGSTRDSGVPIAVTGLAAATTVATGGSHTCALLNGGAISCWGSNTFGELGSNSASFSLTPLAVNGVSGATMVAAGSAHTCALLGGGSVSCWGANYYGQLGNSSGTNSASPVAVTGLTGVVAIAAGADYSCALLSGGTIKCWGYGLEGELGNGSSTNSPTPVTVSGISSATAIATGSYHACALLSGGTVSCWGSNSYGELGYYGSPSNIPVAIAGLSSVTSIAAGGFHTCAVVSGGAFCWGANYFGDLGNGSTTLSYAPVAVTGLTNVTAIEAGYDNTCALLSGGSISCWGNNSRGQLGIGVLDYFTTPQTVLVDCPACQPSGFVPLVPARVLDTRFGQPTSDGQFAGIGPVIGGNWLNLTVLGRGGVPASGVSAVVLNVTVTNPTTPGHVTVWPAGDALPLASNLNFTPGETIPNLVIAEIGINGEVSLFNSNGSTGMIADVVGYFTTASDLTALVPSRLMDTRLNEQTSDGAFAGIGPVAGGNTLDLTVLGRGGVPASGVTTVVLNVTVTNPTTPGYVSVWPSGIARPFTSNLNFTAGQTIPNLVMAKVGSNGKVSLFNSNGNTDIIADVVGYFSTSADFTSLIPSRLMDTRLGQLTGDGLFAGLGPVTGGTTVNLSVWGRGGVPAIGVGAIALNVTAVNPTTAGYISAWPAGSALPLASNLNFTSGETIPNLVIAKVGINGQVSLINSNGSTDIVVDVIGWFPASP
jgi:alpha-tubulin suppressor-like RCC1 family protein